MTSVKWYLERQTIALFTAPSFILCTHTYGLSKRGYRNIWMLRLRERCKISYGAANKEIVSACQNYGCHLSRTPKATQTALSPVSYFPLQGRERLSRHYTQILVHYDYDGPNIEYWWLVNPVSNHQCKFWLHIFWNSMDQSPYCETGPRHLRHEAEQVNPGTADRFFLSFSVTKIMRRIFLMSESHKSIFAFESITAEIFFVQ